MVISKTEGIICAFHWTDPHIGVEVDIASARDHLFPFMPESVPDREFNLAQYRGKKVRITVELIEDDTQESEPTEGNN